jgi:hypothetical protein
MKNFIIPYYVEPPSVSNFAFDTFSGETSSVDLDTHTGELGTPWVNHPHANYTGAMEAGTHGHAYSAAGGAAYYITATPPNADYSVEADFICLTTTANVALTGRMHITDDTMYIIRWNNNVWELRRIITGTQTTIGSTTNQLLTASTTKKVRLQMVGTSISVYINDILEIGPITDGNITAVGKAGIRMLTGASPTTGVHIDNFRAF